LSFHVVFVIISDTQEHADEIARCVEVSLKPLGPPILTLEQAIEKQSFFSSGRAVKKVGDTEGWWILGFVFSVIT